MSDVDEDSSVHNGHYEVEVIVNRPIAQVWRQFLDIPSWVTSHYIECVHGEPGTEGCITRVSFKKAKEMNFPPAHYHYCKFIKVIPERQWILKTYAERGGSYGVKEFHTFDDGRVFAVNADRTRVVFNLFTESQVQGLTKDTAAGALDVSRQGMQENLENLKRIVEAQPRHSR